MGKVFIQNNSADVIVLLWVRTAPTNLSVQLCCARMNLSRVPGPFSAQAFNC